MLDALEEAGVAALGAIPASIEEFWTTLPLADGWSSKTKVVRPKAAASAGKGAKHPLIVMFYGGGFFCGSPLQVTRPAREFAEQYGAVVVCPTYRHTHQVQWPVPMRDGWNALSYLAKNAESVFGANLDAASGGGFVVAGFSAGGTVTAVTTILDVYGDGGSTAGGEPLENLAKPITGAFVGIPLLLEQEMVPQEYRALWTSREDNRYAEGLATANVENIIDSLKVTDFRSPWWSPINTLVSSSAVNRHEGWLPRIYIQVCQLDPLRDDGIIFEKILASKGFETKIDVFPDDGHAAWTALPFPTKSKEPTIAESTMAGVAWVLKE